MGKKPKEESLMGVNWDEIEKRYVETPIRPDRHVNYSPQSTDHALIIDNKSLLNHLSSTLIQKRPKLDVPDAIDEPHVNRDRSIQKPDGG